MGKINEGKKESSNFFKICGIETLEMVHSNILAWLFNPKENHGFGCDFLKIFLEKCIEKRDSMILVLNPKDRENIPQFVEPEAYNDFIIKTEVVKDKERKDILIEKDNYCICIENKFTTEDHDEQLMRYKNELKPEYKNLLLVYLTPFGTPPVEKNCIEWICFSYSEILEILSTLTMDLIENEKTTNQLVIQYLKNLKDVLSENCQSKRDMLDFKVNKILNEDIIPIIRANYHLVQREKDKELIRFYSECFEKSEFEKNDKDTMRYKNIIFEINENKFICFEFGNLKTDKTSIKCGEMQIRGNKLDWKGKNNDWRNFKSSQDEYNYIKRHKSDILDFIEAEIKKNSAN